MYNTSFLKQLIFILLLSSTAFCSFAQQWIIIDDNKVAENTISLPEAKADESILEFKLNAYRLKSVQTPSGKKNIVVLKDGTQLLQKGKPDLPIRSQAIVIADNKQMAIQLLEVDYFDIPNIEIAPSKGGIKRSRNRSVAPYIYDDIYEEDAFFPKENVWLERPYILRNNRASIVKIAPFQYNPVTKVLRVYKTMKIKIYPTNRPAKVNPLLRKNSSTPDEFKTIFKRKFPNYHTDNSLKYNQLDEGTPGRMLIISASEYLNIMQPLVDWKNQKGIVTDIVNVDAIGDSLAIKAFIQEYYNDYDDFIYLLLVGNIDQVPPSHTTPDGWGESYGGNCDNAYAHLAGDDHYADIFVGRFSGNGPADIATQVERVIHYERDIQASETWMTKSVFSASGEDGSNYGVIGDDGESDEEHLENIKADLAAFGYSTHSENEIGGTNRGLQNFINSGCGQFQYTGHGSFDGVGNVPFYIANVANLTNSHQLPFIMTVGCSTGNYFANSCFSQSLLTADYHQTPTGSIGVAGSIIAQYWAAPMDAQDEVVDLLTQQYDDNIKLTLGGVMFNGFFHMMDEYTSIGDTPGLSQGEEMADYWVVFGDPSLLLRTQSQEKMVISHDAGIAMGASEFVVNCNTDGALVALTIENEIQGTGFVENGAVSIVLNNEVSQNTGEVLITVTAPNKTTYQREVYINEAINPVAAFMAPIVDVETGQRITFENQSSHAPTSFFWTFEGGEPAVSTDRNPTVTYNTPGVYFVELMAVNEAGNNVKQRSNYIRVSDPSLCIPSIIETTTTEYISRVSLNEIDNASQINSGYEDFTSMIANVEAGSTNTMTLEMQCDPDYYRYQILVWIDWDENGSFYDDNEFIYATTINQNLSLPLRLDTVVFVVPDGTQSGQKRMRIKFHDSSNPNYLPCGETYYGEIEDYTINVTGNTTAVSSTAQKSHFIIYPNPSSGQLTITLPTSNNNTVVISDLSGKKVLEKNVTRTKAHFDLGQLPNGIYLVSWRTAKSTITKKFILQR